VLDERARRIEDRLADMRDEVPNARIVALFPAERAAAHLRRPDLGPLVALPGTWVGTGLRLTALPDPDPRSKTRLLLEVHKTNEALAFAAVTGPAGESAMAEADSGLAGVHYVHQVTDAVVGDALRREPGLWLNAHESSDVAASGSFASWAATARGALLAAGTWLEQAGAPEIPPISSMPVDLATGRSVAARDHLDD
jgi:hypothetical protein